MCKYLHTNTNTNNDMIFQTHKHIIRECAVSSCAKIMYSRHQKKKGFQFCSVEQFFFAQKEL